MWDFVKCLCQSLKRLYRHTTLHLHSSILDPKTIEGWSNKWLGVSGIISVGLADWYVSGLEFNNASAPIHALVNSSSVTYNRLLNTKHWHAGLQVVKVLKSMIKYRHITDISLVTDVTSIYRKKTYI